MIFGPKEITLAVILTALFLAYSIFAYRYVRYSPWNATWQGVVLEAQKITLAGTVAFFVFDTAMPGDWPGRYSILVILLTLLAVEAWATLAGLIHIQRQRPKDVEPNPETAETPVPDVDHRQ